MNTTKQIISLVILCFWTTLPALSRRPIKLLMGGSGWNKIAIMDKDTHKIEWEYPLQPGWECNSVAATKGGDIVFSYSRGAKLITLEGKEIWNVDAPSGCEMQTARVLPGGNFLLAWNGHPSVIMELAPDGKVLSQTTYEPDINNPHAQFRQVCKTADGNYLLPLFGTSEVREINPQGELVKVVKLEGTPFTTLPVSKNEYWITCGDGHSLLLVNWKTEDVLQRYGEHDFSPVRLFFPAGIYPTRRNKTYYLCNWQGHSPESERGGNPQVIQFDAKGRIVWQLADTKNIGMISSICECPASFLKRITAKQEK